MSIYLYTGIPGSGKTYRAVYEVHERGIKSKYHVLHNIPGMKPEDSVEYIEFTAEHIRWEWMKERTKQQQEKDGKNLYIIIDEADKLGFDRDNHFIRDWISRHRHLGQDIILISQDYKNIHRAYVGLVECEIRAKKGAILNQFIYQWQVNGEKFKTDRLPKKKHIFNSYQSFLQDSQKKPVNKMMLFIGFGAIFTILLGFYFIKSVPKLFGGKQNNPPVHQQFSSSYSSEQQLSNITAPLVYIGISSDQPYIIDQYGNRSREYENCTIYDYAWNQIRMLCPDDGIIEIERDYIIRNHSSLSSARGKSDSERPSVRSLAEVYIK